MSDVPFAIITPSYEGDLERCKLLCESMDAMAQGSWHHYLLVADHDEHLFHELANEKRSIILDSQLLPSWLRPVRQPFDKRKRWRWISTGLRNQVWPMTGWHVQQLRKMLVARHISEPVLVMADSDSFFVRAFGVQAFLEKDTVRLQRTKAEIREDDAGLEKHVLWTRSAHTLLGLPEPAFPADGYINNLVSWRRNHALSMLQRIEQMTGTDVVTAVGRHRTFSEYQIYGTYVAEVMKMEGHWPAASALSLTYWDGEAMTEDALKLFVAKLKPEQLAVCVQSFTKTSTNLLRDLTKTLTAKAGDKSQV
ncbi:MAG: DUF6492 family protein [Beijerinckiaceae bacterium]